MKEMDKAIVQTWDAREILVPVTDGKQLTAICFEPPFLQTRSEVGTLIFYPEAFGVNGWARRTAYFYAQLGFRVILVDLHWRQDRWIQYEYSDQTRPIALDYVRRLSVDQSVQDLACCIQYARELEKSNGKVGVIGYCIGGTIALRALVEGLCDVVIGYYVTDLANQVHRVRQLGNNCVFHFASDDPPIPLDAVAVLKTKETVQGTVTVYDGTLHGFCREGFAPYNHMARNRSMEKNIPLLTTFLGGR